MSRKIKVCGMKVPANIKEVAQLGPDMMGFIFYNKSPRLVNEQLSEWMAQQPEVLEGIQKVGVFVNAEVDVVLNAVHDFSLDWVQLHGEESPDYCALLQNVFNATSMQKAGIIKAFRVNDRFDFELTQDYGGKANLFLFDTHGESYGGTGEKFSWEILKNYKGNTPFILSGGIGPDDIKALKSIDLMQWYGIDLNSRFEIKPGVKDIETLKTFFEEYAKEIEL